MININPIIEFPFWQINILFIFLSSATENAARRPVRGVNVVTWLVKAITFSLADFMGVKWLKMWVRSRCFRTRQRRTQARMICPPGWLYMAWHFLLHLGDQPQERTGSLQSSMLINAEFSISLPRHSCWDASDVRSLSARRISLLTLS